MRYAQDIALLDSMKRSVAWHTSDTMRRVEVLDKRELEEGEGALAVMGRGKGGSRPSPRQERGFG